MPDISEHDEMTHWRCPSLGGPVTFKHCRKANDSLPCPKLLVCWENILDAPGFLTSNYTPEELQKAFGAQAKGKLEVILDALKKTGRGEG
ncbi:MAG TPA: hypothetical protein PKH33_05505 [bacterium]|nr:hypothetical protein [bacterium]